MSGKKNVDHETIYKITKMLRERILFKMEKVGKGPVVDELNEIIRNIDNIQMRLTRIQNYERMPENVYVIHDDGRIVKMKKWMLFELAQDEKAREELLSRP